MCVWMACTKCGNTNIDRLLNVLFHIEGENWTSVTVERATMDMFVVRCCFRMHGVYLLNWVLIYTNIY